MRKEYEFLQGFLDAVTLDSDDVAHVDVATIKDAMEDCSDILAELVENHHQPSDSKYYDLGQACGEFVIEPEIAELPELFDERMKAWMREKFTGYFSWSPK